MSTIKIAQISGLNFVQFFYNFCLTNAWLCDIIDSSARIDRARAAILSYPHGFVNRQNAQSCDRIFGIYAKGR